MSNLSDALPLAIFEFLRLYTELLTAPFRDFFDAVYRGFWTALTFQARHGG